MHLDEHDHDHVTKLLNEAASGRAEAVSDLLPLVYAQLRRIAQRRMSDQKPGHTLQATELVHEAYMRLVGRDQVSWQGRAHFYFAAARAMQDILVEHARAKARLKRGGDGRGTPARRVPLNVLDLAADADPGDIVALDAAVRRLEAEEPDVAAVVRLRFYAGLTGDQVAQALDLSPRQVDRLWAYARAWLYRHVERMD